MSKKLEEKQRRRLAEERKKEALKKAHRRRNLTTTVIALVVAGGVIGLVVNDRNQRREQLENFGVSAAEANCGDVEEQEEQSRDHIELGAAHEPYTTNPPTSGPHYNSSGLGPVPTGFYEDAADALPEGVVHNLEHGQIVIYYNPDAPEDVIADVELAVRSEPVATVATPFSGIQGDANLVLTAWTVAQSCEQVSIEILNEFRSAYQGTMGPEPLTRTFDG